MNHSVLRRITFAALLAGGLHSAASAQPAILEDGVLNIEDGVVLSEDGNLFYKDIRLEAEEGGRFRVLAAEPRNLAHVDSVDVLILESFPVQVRVQVEGYLPVPCIDLEEPAVRRVGSVFEIYLPETELDPLVLCAQVIKPFSISIPLDTADLPAGEYQVIVNGVEAAFTLPG